MKEPPGLDHAGPGRIAAARFIDSRTSPWPRRLALAAIGIACTLAALHGSFYVSYTVRHVVPSEIGSWFDMRCDYSVPSWFGFACMLAAGVACFGWGRAVGSASIKLTGIFFTLLMIDDLCLLHERVGAAFWAAMQFTGIYSWVIVLGMPFAVAGVAACRACRRHLVSDRRASIRLFTGFACLGVALALEAMELRTTNSGIRLRGFDLVLYSQWVEEFLELIGPLLIAWTAAEAWQRTMSKRGIAKT
jgi:hypothetical protein